MLTKLLRHAAPLALLLSAPNALAQDAAQAPAAKDADPALWVVKDKDTTIYLFGTVHILKPGLSWFDEAVKKAFDASGELVTEIGGTPDPAAVQQTILKLGFNPTGPTLTERLPEEKRAEFVKAVADLGLPPASFDRVDPWVASIQIIGLSAIRLGYNPQSGVEAALNNAAKAANKPVSGLETVDEQFGFFDSLSDGDQIKLLVETIDKLAETGPTLDAMIAEWGAGDAERLAARMNEGFKASPDLAKKLLADRNARWAEWIDERLDKPGVVFVAVGAGHLAGPESVQAYLKTRKIKTKRMKY
ncbi:TraB/GumN family protein [Sphingomonas sp. BT-65]|uniref:TraB/GumN family protein n=1 Tax=Sphingomonas sp. BT-65 TaxID=2989821 RepID=UPI0022358B05|nr:TraB/GumN family protein [Sphingomonas sp. BT-65]MCW4462166.1 TraB/GumN family protein [Sphingomonas sp. BT-65]